VNASDSSVGAANVVVHLCGFYSSFTKHFALPCIEGSLMVSSTNRPLRKHTTLPCFVRYSPRQTRSTKLGYQCTGDCIQHDQQCRYEEYPCSCLWLMSTLRIMGPSKYFFTDTSLVFLMSLKIFPVMIISPQPSCRLRLEHPQMGTPLHLAFCLHSPHRPSRFAHPQEQHRRPPLLRHPVE
jgi:hypothetical protein